MSWQQIWQFLTTETTLLWTTIVSAVVSAIVSYLFKRYELRDRLRTEYEYEQRKKLKDLISRYYARLLLASTSLSRRFWNLYQNENRGWLNVSGDYGSGRYYFTTFVHRFLNIFVLIRQFEREAVFLDARIADKQDFLLLNYLEILRRVMTDVALFNGIDYDTFRQHDHFFADKLRQYCDLCWVDGEFISLEALTSQIKDDRSLDAVLKFFDSLNSSEDRLRWDRLVAFHLLLLSFINTFGYETQRSTDKDFLRAAQEVRHQRILRNLVNWLPSHGLGNHREASRIRRAYAKTESSNR